MRLNNFLSRRIAKKIPEPLPYEQNLGANKYLFRNITGSASSPVNLGFFMPDGYMIPPNPAISLETANEREIARFEAR
jgi:hypothetical protein